MFADSPQWTEIEKLLEENKIPKIIEEEETAAAHQ